MIKEIEKLASGFTVQDDYYSFLTALVKKFKPGVIVELGTAAGVSAAALADGNPEGQVVTYNTCDQLRKENYRPNVSYRIKDSREGANDFNDLSVNLLFIDTDHKYHQVMDEWGRWKAKLAPGAIVIFDDCSLDPGMEEAMRDIEMETGKKIHNFKNLHWSGFGILVN